MHEMGIAMRIVEIATSAIPDNMKNVQVERVNLEVGKLSSVVPASLCFCFEIVTRDTLLSGAKLDVREIPVVARCRECNLEWSLRQPVFIYRKSARPAVWAQPVLQIQPITSVPIPRGPIPPA